MPRPPEGRGLVAGVVVTEGGPPSLTPRGPAVVKHAPVIVSGVTEEGARMARRTRADAAGRFRLLLPPGRYTIAADIFPIAPVQPHRRVTVRAGRMLRIWAVGSFV